MGRFISGEEVRKNCGNCKCFDDKGRNPKFPECTQYGAKCFSVLDFCKKSADQEMERSIDAAERANERYWSSVIEW